MVGTNNRLINQWHWQCIDASEKNLRWKSFDPLCALPLCLIIYVAKLCYLHPWFFGQGFNIQGFVPLLLVKQGVTLGNPLEVSDTDYAPSKDPNCAWAVSQQVSAFPLPAFWLAPAETKWCPHLILFWWSSWCTARKYPSLDWSNHF